MIPCKECVCLAMCNSRHDLHCSIMFEYLDMLETKDDDKWAFLEEMFNIKGNKIIHVYESLEALDTRFVMVKAPHPNNRELKNFVMLKDTPEGITKVFCKDVSHLQGALNEWKYGRLYDFEGKEHDEELEHNWR